MTWVNDSNAPLLTDLYQLKMAQAYFKEGLAGTAAFDLYVRRLPPARSFLLACGLDDALGFLERLSFDRGVLDHLAELRQFSPDFLEWLAHTRFTGDVYAIPEGTPVFAGEPIVEVVAPLAEAQLVETFVTNQIHLQTVLASKATRIVEAAAGRPVVDFSLRRSHGIDAGLKGARAFYVAGVASTSNVLAGRTYGIPVAGTMAHSYVQAHEDEGAAFRAFLNLYPDGVVLVDTYDTLGGVRRLIALARELGERGRVSAIRLDSGDLEALSRAARREFDEAGLDQVEIFASGGLDEHSIDVLVRSGAPIDGFGVGTLLGVSADAPTLDMVYKLVEYDGRGRTKLSADKQVLGGRKQVFRGKTGDVIAKADERHAGRGLLVPVMRSGRRVFDETLEAIRDRARREIAALPERCRALGPIDPPYPVEVSSALSQEQERLANELRKRSLASR
jgi:nicotinate phosphoribosyltransferase